MSKFLVIIILLVSSSLSYADQPGSVLDTIPDPEVPKQVRLHDVLLKQITKNPFEYVQSDKFRFKEELTHPEFFQNVSRNVVFSFATVHVDLKKLSLNDIEELHLAIIRGGYVRDGILYNLQNVRWIIQTDLDHVQFWARFNKNTFKTMLLTPTKTGPIYAVTRRAPFMSVELESELEKKQQELSKKMTADIIKRARNYNPEVKQDSPKHRGVLHLKRPNPPGAPLCPQLF